MKKKNMLFVLLAVLLPVVFFFKILLADTGKPLSKPISPKSVIQNLSPTSIGDEQLNKAEVVQRTRKLQMPFIANEGQTDERVMFYANTFGGTVFVTKNGEIVYSLPQRKNGGADVNAHNRPVTPHKYPINNGEKGNAGGFDDMHHHSPANIQSAKAGGQNDTKQDDGKQGHSEDKQRQGARGVVLKEEIVGGWIDKIKGEKKATTTVNDFRGNDQSKWKTNLQTYEVVTLGEVYNGIELKLKAYGNNVEKLFYVKPGADPTAIKLKLSGAKTLKVNEDGLLEAETALGIVKFTKPIVYQEPKVSSTTTKKSRSSAPLAEKGRSEGALSDRQYIEAAYVVIGNEYSFKLEDYDRTQGLVIDPLLASISLGGTGGAGEDSGNAIAIDSGGNIYVTGYTSSANFPTTSGTYDTSYNGDFNYSYSTGDAFVSKLNSDLTSLLASTYLGVVGEESGNAIAIDSGGNIYVTGSTGSTDFPTTPGAYNTSGSGFLSRLSNDLTSLLASTYLGNACNAIAIDTGGNIYVGGEIGDYSDSYYTTVSKLNGALTSLLGSTSLKGGYRGSINAIAIDSEGNVYLTGSEGISNFPTTPGAYDTSFNGGYDAFVSKLNSALTSLLASTYLGGDGDDSGNDIAIDSGGNIYVTGSTGSTDFPTTPGAYDTSGSGFVSRLSNDLTSLLASTYSGNSGNSIAIDTGGNIYVAGGDAVSKLNGELTSLLGSKSLSGGSISATAIDSDGNVYVTGETYSSDFPTTPDAYEPFFNFSDRYDFNYNDAFVSKLNDDLTSLLASTYLGGGFSDGGDSGNAIAIDSGGNIYVTGSTSSPDFPTTSGAYDTSFNFNDSYDWSPTSDAFVSKLNSDLTSLLTSTYLGGVGDDSGKAIAIDFGGNIYVTGSTGSTDFPTTPGAYDTSGSGFVSRLSNDLTSLLASTYSGNSGNSIAIDTGGNIYVAGGDTVSKLNGELTSLLGSKSLSGGSISATAIDSDGNVYVTGETYSSDFPTTSAAFATSFNGYSDAFVSKLNSDLTSLLASTYLGGTSYEEGNSIAIDAWGNIYVTGSTESTDFPTTPGAYDTVLYDDFWVAFVSKLNGDLTDLLASTSLGGFTYGGGNSIATDSVGNIYVAGVIGSYLSSDAFVLQLNGELTDLLNYTVVIKSNDRLYNSAESIAMGPGGNIYVTGGASASFNVVKYYYNDVFVSKIEANLGQVTVPYVSTDITVDGNLDESAWDIANDISNVVIGTTNNTATFGVLWDNTYLYVGIKVLDDTLYNDSTYVHEDDSVEIYIDGDHNHGTTYDSYDRQFIKGWNDETLFEKKGKKTDVLHAWATITGGYSIELVIPWSNLGITPTAGMAIGFSVAYNDDDDGGEREGQAMWRGTANNYLDTSALGDIVLGEMPSPITVSYVSDSLMVDGNLDESAWDIATDVSNVVIGTTNNTATFGVLWDNTYLYVGMKVLDDTLYNDSTKAHENDSVEIYIDGDHNHSTTYDSYDRQFIKGWNDETLFEKKGKKTGVLHAWATITGGYSIELAIPWSNLGITPTAGMTIGFSVGYNDDDDGGEREGQAMWRGTANNYLDTSALGDIVLGEAPPQTPTPTSTPTPSPTPIFTPPLTPTPSPVPSPSPTVSPTPIPTPTPLVSPLPIPYVSTNLTVDGNLDESAWDIATDVSNVVIGTTNNTAKFGVLWDSSYLYVGMEVLDDNLYNDSTYVHEDDSVEIYIDGDHNHSTTYDSYDRQFIKGWNDETLFEKKGKKTDVLHAWATITGGYSIELAIPWSNLGITPTAGMTIGFSVGYNDDDDGSGREGQAIWIGTANNYLDTSSFGDIVLGEVPPDVSATNPVSNATGVAVDSVITATFNEAMDAGSITPVTFLVSDGSGTIGGTVSYSGTTATFTPSGTLTYSTMYTVTVTPGVRDVAGNAMPADYTWSFTTGAAPTSVFTAYNDLSWSAGQVNTMITLYTTGQSGLLKDYFTGTNTPVTLTIAGGDISHSNHLIQGSNANSGTDAYTVFNGIVNSVGLISYSATNLTFNFTGLDPSLNYEFVLLGNRNKTTYTNRITTTTISDVVSFTNSSTPGVTFSGATDPAVTIVNGYNTVNGYVARFTNINPGADGDMLITVSSPTGQFYANALMLKATQLPDTLPPELSATSPVSNATEVAINSVITATFNEAMDAGSITPSTFLVSDGGGTIGGTVSYSGTTATFTPSGTLSYSTTYTATVTTGVKDMAGNAMAANYTWSFTTGAAPTSVFTAYNDLSWSAGQVNTKITLYTTGQSGLLKDYFTGTNTQVTLTIAGGDISHSNHLIQGSNANSGTDADTVFNGIVNSVGLISYSATNLTFTFTGLDPNLNYEFVLLGNRNKTTYTNRITTTTISDVVSFTNASTPGATFSGATDPAVTIVNGYNTVNGYVARFTNINPGADGDMLITVSSPTGQFYANALMLRATQ